MLLKCSWCDDTAIRQDVAKANLREEDLIRKTLVLDERHSSSSSPPQSPALPLNDKDKNSQGFSLMTFTAVVPQN